MEDGGNGRWAELVILVLTMRFVSELYCVLQLPLVGLDPLEANSAGALAAVLYLNRCLIKQFILQNIFAYHYYSPRKTPVLPCTPLSQPHFTWDDFSWLQRLFSTAPAAL